MPSARHVAAAERSQRSSCSRKVQVLPRTSCRRTLARGNGPSSPAISLALDPRQMPTGLEHADRSSPSPRYPCLAEHRPRALTTRCPVAKIAKPEKQFPIFQLAQALRPDTRRLIRHSPTRGRQPKLAQPSPDRRLPSSWGPALASLAPNDRGVVANLPNLLLACADRVAPKAVPALRPRLRGRLAARRLIRAGPDFTL